MRASAYVLVTVTSGKAREVRDQITKLRDVTLVDAVLGPYDLIASVTGADFNSIGNLVIEKMHSIQGVERTLTCNVIVLEE